MNRLFFTKAEYQAEDGPRVDVIKGLQHAEMQAYLKTAEAAKTKKGQKKEKSYDHKKKGKKEKMLRPQELQLKAR